MDITLVSIVNQSQVALTALGGMILLREREHIVQHLIGVGLAMAGLILVNVA